MNVHDEMSDNEVLRAASDSLSAIPMASPPDVEAIMARGRARRRHRLSAVAGLSVAAAAAGTALVLGLTGVLGPARTSGTIRTASFTLVSNPNGTATLTISPKELLDPAALQSDLVQYGIPAKVTTGSFCSSDPAPTGFSQVVSSHPAGPDTATPQTRCAAHDHDRPGGHASGHRAQRRRLPAHARASSRPTSCSSTPAPTPAAAPRLARTAYLTATAHLTASGCYTAAPARPGRNQPRVATALA